jgi:hypothetical protein
MRQGKTELGQDDDENGDDKPPEEHEMGGASGSVLEDSLVTQKVSHEPAQIPKTAFFPAHLPGRPPSCEPTNMIRNAAAMSKGSKAVSNALFPPVFSFLGEFPDIERESTGKEDQYQ